MKTLFILFLSFSSIVVVAEDMSCAFKKSLIFGASINAGYSGPGDIFWADKNSPLNSPHMGQRSNPGAE